MRAAGPAVVLMNAASGVTPAEGSARERAVGEALRAAGVSAEVRGVQGRRVAAEASDALSRGATTLVAAGGDGTVSAVAGVVAGRADVEMGVMPMGTLNHFAKDLGVPTDLAGAARVIAAGNVRRVDVAEVGGRCFVNNASIGIYPFLVRRREEIRHRWGRGKWAAMVAAVLSLVRRHPMVHVRIEAEGRCEEQATPFVFVGNNNYEMELLSLGRRAALDRGELCLYFARRTGRWGLFRLALRAAMGRLKQDRDFEMACVREVCLSSRRKELLLALDGEVVEVTPPLVFRSRAGALRVIAPEEGERGPSARPLNGGLGT